MTRTATRLSPLIEAERARQVVGVLTWIERRFVVGAWARGARFGSDGSICLIGGIDEASGWTVGGVAEEVTSQLVSRLPSRSLRAIGRVRPRLALALYNDVVGGRSGAYELVRATRAELGGLGPAGVPRRATVWSSHVATATSREIQPVEPTWWSSPLAPYNPDAAAATHGSADSAADGDELFAHRDRDRLEA